MFAEARKREEADSEVFAGEALAPQVPSEEALSLAEGPSRSVVHQGARGRMPDRPAPRDARQRGRRSGGESAAVKLSIPTQSAGEVLDQAQLRPAEGCCTRASLCRGSISDSFHRMETARTARRLLDRKTFQGRGHAVGVLPIAPDDLVQEGDPVLRLLGQPDVCSRT